MLNNLILLAMSSLSPKESAHSNEFKEKVHLKNIYIYIPKFTWKYKELS